MRSFSDLHSEQKEAINFILNNKVGCLTPGCGGGKSIIGLTSFAAMQKLKTAKTMLVVCVPKGIKETWRKEHLNWEHTKHLRVATLSGTPEHRLKLLRTPHDVYCISYNSLEWLTENKGSLKFDFVFADEGSCLKGHASKWRRHLINCAPNPTYRFIATATPAPHDAMDYWGLCKYLDDGRCLESPNITAFRSRYCKAIPLGNTGGMRWVLRDKDAVKEIEERVKHLFYSFELRKEIPIEVVTFEEELSEESLELYQKVEKDQCLNSLLFTELGQFRAQDSLDAMALSNKLAQMTNGFVYVDASLRLSDSVLSELESFDQALNQKKRRTIHLFDDRIDAFKRMVDHIHEQHGPDVKVAISYLFKYDLEMLQRAFPTGVSDEEEGVEDRWNRKEIDYLFLQYGRSSKSLNLQKGGYILAVYSPTFNWEHDYQIARRFARQGQKESVVYVYRLYLKDTVDENKIKVLEKREVNHRNFQRKIVRQYKRGKQ